MAALGIEKNRLKAVFFEGNLLTFLHAIFACLHTFGADLDTRTISKRRPLEVGVLAALANRVELCRTNAV